MKIFNKRVLAFILVVMMLVASGVMPTVSAATDAFALDMKASINAEDSSVMDVVITIKDIKQELYAIEMLLNFDDTLVEGVYKENTKAEMDVFMTKTPTYILKSGDIEIEAPRYEQMCYYDAENSRYELRFCDLISYPFDKGGVEYKGLIEDGELVITVPFKILGEAKEGTKYTFTGENVSGTTKATLESVSGSCNTATYTVVTPTEPPTEPKTEPETKPTTEPETKPTAEPDTQPVTEPAAPGYYLVGTLNGEDKWYVDASSSDRLFALNPYADGEYMLNWTFCSGDEIKVVYYDGTAITAWYKDQAENYIISSNEIGDCTVYFRPDGWGDWIYTYFTVISNEIPIETSTQTPTETTPTEPVIIADPGFYLVGTLNGSEYWYVDGNSSDRLLTVNPYAEGEYMLDWTFCEGDEIKVVYFDGTQITAWYKDVSDNYKVNSNEIGDCTVYFRPDGRDDWFYTFFVLIPKEEPTEPTEPTTEPVTDPSTDPETVAPTEPEKLLGDVDVDGEISILDATILQLYLAQKYDLTDEQKELSDTSKDGVVSIIDATYIQMFVAEIITEF